MDSVILAIILFISAFLCLAIEAFILPGFGITGILGIALLGVAIGFSWIKFGYAWGIGTLFISSIIFIGGIWLISKTRFGKRFVQTESLKGAVSAIGHDWSHLVGKEGTAISDLHPVGSAMVEGQKVDCITKGKFIDRGAKIKVVEAKGVSVIVEEVKNEERKEVKS